MIIRMENEGLSLPQMEALLETSQEVRFAAKGRKEIYEWVERVLVRQEYAMQGKRTRGVVRAYLAKMTGKSLPQITRLVRQYRETGQVRARIYRRRKFVRVYTEADVRLLAKVDRAHERLSGPATRRILERKVEEYGHQEYARLTQISVGHLYNLRKRPDYRKQVALYEATLVGPASVQARTGALAGNVALPNDGLANPGLAVAPDSSRVYATFDSQTVVVYDVATGMVASTWQTTRALTWTTTGTLTLSPDGQTLYTAGQVLTAFDTATGNIQGTVNPPGSSGSYSFVGSAVSSDGGTLYASYAAQIGTGSGLATIDTASLAITGSASLGSELQQPVLSKDGSTLYVPDAIDSLLYVVSASNLAATGSIALQGPIATATLSADGSALYVPNSSTPSTLAVDTSSLAVIASIGVGGTANPDGGDHRQRRG